MAPNSCSCKDYSEDAISRMREGGARITKARQFVVDILDTSTHPLSAQEIMELAKEKKISIDLASVYRILHYLEDLALVHQVGPHAKFVKCAHNHCSSHMHVITNCNNCQETIEINLPAELQTDLIKYISKHTSLRLEPSALQVTGICKDCES